MDSKGQPDPPSTLPVPLTVPFGLLPTTHVPKADKLRAIPPPPILGPACPSLPLASFPSQDECVSHCSNRDTFGVKRATVHYMWDHMFITWTAQLTGHTASLFRLLCKDAEYKGGVLCWTSPAAPEEQVLLEWWGHPNILSPMWGLPTQCLSCPSQ